MTNIGSVLGSIAQAVIGELHTTQAAPRQDGSSAAEAKQPQQDTAGHEEQLADAPPQVVVEAPSTAKAAVSSKQIPAEPSTSKSAALDVKSGPSRTVQSASQPQVEESAPTSEDNAKPAPSAVPVATESGAQLVVSAGGEAATATADKKTPPKCWSIKISTNMS